MNTGSKDKLLGVESSRPATAEQRLRQLGIKLPTPPEPFGIYAEAVQTGNLLFLTGMLPTVGREAKFIGRIGAELDVQTGRQAAYLAALNASLSRGSIWDRWTKLRGSSGSACWWPLREMSGSSRKSLTALQSCCKMFSEKTKTLADWCTA
jgi:hypothetical protein